MPFIFTPTDLPEVIKIESKTFPDERGEFSEVYKASDFKANGIGYDFVQDNFPLSKKGVVRGLHYQLPPYTQGKLVAVIKGKIWDVAVDIRKSSPTFGKWVAEELSDENHRMLFIPPGFAHGFIALEDDTRVLYKMTDNEFTPSADRGIRYDDPDLNIPWPIERPILSEKDKKHPFLKDAEVFE
jgi:dTDP-4-dehydrorhamnose 3,5-epimerase